MFNELPDVLTVPQAAAALQVCPTYLRQLCRERKIAAAKAGDKWLIAKPALIDFITSGGTAHV